jgi:hypothetical protein
MTPRLLFIPIYIALLGLTVSTFFHVPVTANSFSCDRTNACSVVAVGHVSASQQNSGIGNNESKMQVEYDNGYADGIRHADHDSQWDGSCPDNSPYCEGYRDGYGCEWNHTCSSS